MGICQTIILTLVSERSTLIHHLEVVLLMLALFDKVCESATNTCNPKLLMIVTFLSVFVLAVISLKFQTMVGRVVISFS